MKNRTLVRSLVLAGTVSSLALAQTASADTIKAKFTSSLGMAVNVTSPVNNGNVNTVKFSWTRTDTPGPGVDFTIPNNFNTYCVDLAQYVSANTNYTYNVVTPAAHGFTANQETLLSRLWATQFSNVDTANESAAFQVAVWEIVYDTNATLTSGTFVLNNASAVATLAQGWLNTITDANFSFNGTLPQISVLESSTAQDQITVLPSNVPAAGTGVLGLAGLGLLAKRQRRSAR